MELGDAGSLVEIYPGVLQAYALAYSRRSSPRALKTLPQAACEKSQVCCESERVEANCENHTQCMRVGSPVRGIV